MHAIRSVLSRPINLLGFSIVFLFILAALIGPWIAPYEVNEQIPDEARQPPSRNHWFGTDNLGRDVYSRVLFGAREILLLAGTGTLIAIAIGTLLGLLTGYYGGRLDQVFMRLFDSFLAIPALLFALLLLGTMGNSPISILIVIVMVYIPIVARVVRSVTLSIKSLAYVDAARTQGEPVFSILYHDILPGIYPALSVEAALRFSYAIFLVASLGFLGIGIQPPNPNWGLMVREARQSIAQIPWALFFPAIAISLVVIGVNLTSDGLRQIWSQDK